MVVIVHNKLSTLEMAQLGYQRACDAYHAAIAGWASPEELRAARLAWRRSLVILRAAEAWEAAS